MAPCTKPSKTPLLHSRLEAAWHARVAGELVALLAEEDDARPRLLVRTEPRLKLGVTDPRTGAAYAGSATSWYLAASNDVPTLEFGRSTETPVITQWTLDRGQWGFGFGVTWDCGAKALDFRGLHWADA